MGTERLIKIYENTIYVKTKIETLANLCQSVSPNKVINTRSEKKLDLKDNENVIVYYNGYLYRGQIMGSKKSKCKSHLLYRIHYNGWNKAWDEWVNSERVFECTSINEDIREKLELFCNPKGKASKEKKNRSKYCSSFRM